MCSGGLNGTFYTTTALEATEKEKIRTLLNSLGASYVSSLSTKVTLLIVGSENSEKMLYCLKNRRDVTFFDHSNIMNLSNLVNSSPSTKIDKSVFDLHFPWLLFNRKIFSLARLSDTDFPLFEKDYISNLIEHFGGKVTSSLSEKTDYFITLSPSGTRYKTACGWRKPVLHPKWVIDCCNCAHLLEYGSYDISKFDNPRVIEEINNHSSIRMSGVDYGKMRNNYLLPKSNRVVRSTNDLFKGFVFSYLNFNDDRILKLTNVIKQFGGEVNDERDLKNVSFVLIPSDKPRPDECASDKFVNEWFIERCIHYKKIIIDSWSIPRPFLNLKYKFKVHITGFGSIEHSHLRKLITNLNLVFSDELTNDCNFLIANLSLLGLTEANSPQLFKYRYKDLLNSRNKVSINPDLTKRKINSAKRWDIPVVSIAFIWELSEIGVLPDVLDSKWCIFGPQSVKPATNFLEYARSVSSGTFQTQKSKESDLPISEDNDISQHNSPTKIFSFSNCGSSPVKRNRQMGGGSDSIQIDGNKLNLREWQRREREKSDEEREETLNWWMEPDSDLMPVFKKRR